MIPKRLIGLGMGVVLLVGTSVWGESDSEDPRAERVWTDRLGREVTATWDWDQEGVLQNLQTDDSLDYPLPMIRARDEKAFALPLERLSEEDRNLVLEYRKSQLNAEDDPFAGAPIPDKKTRKKATSSRTRSKTTTAKSSDKVTPKKERVSKPKAGEEWTQTIEDVKFTFRYCPAGIFLVPAGKQIARFRVDEGFWMLATEVTQEQWKVIMGNNPAHFKADTARPVEQVNWFDANRFCEKIGEKLGTKAFLPTALQWTWASCAGEPITMVHRDLLAKAWMKGNSDGKTHAAAQLTPNAWGLYDMYGNVWEWCAECRDSRKQPVLPGTPERKETSALHCGGSWYGESPELGKETWRDADQKIFDVGFRFCVSEKPKD